MNQQLYEKLINNISEQVYNSINEAYENQLLEEYNAKDLFKDICDETSKDTIIAYKYIKKVLVAAIEKLQQTHQYKEAESIVNEYKRKIKLYIKEHRKITPHRALIILVTVLSIYGGISLVHDCSSAISSAEKELASPDTTRIDRTGLSTKHVNKTMLNTPAKVFKNDPNYQFKSSKKAHDFIKNHEYCLLYPYYANDAEMKAGKVTIGYGHVIEKTDGALYDKVEKLKKQGKINKSFDIKKEGYVLRKKHAPEIITQALADMLFDKDIKIAETRAFNSIMNMDIDENVRCYMLYNQNIRDGFTSLCYNAGTLKSSKYSFITKGLLKCGYDFKHNCINRGDYNVSFSLFKNILDNPVRRNEEYMEFFCYANKPINLSLIS